MASQATITAKDGAGQTVTALVLPNLTRFDLQLGGKSVLQTESDLGKKEFDVSATATLTCTIATGNATIVVNQ